MPAQSALIKNFSEFGGLDARSNDISRKERFARATVNVFPLANNSLSSRPGSKGRAANVGGGGTVSYLRKANGVVVEECVTVDNKLRRLKSGSMTVTYTGAGDSASLSILPYMEGSTDPELATFQFRCIITVDDVEILNQALGTGLEGTPYSIGSLIAAIEALDDFTCSGTGTTSGPAAFLPNITTEVVSTGTVIAFEYWEDVPCPLATPFSAFSATFGTDTFRLASLFNHADRLFVATGKGPLYKYDGVSACRTGMPAATTYGCAEAAGAGNPNGSYTSFITYEYIDATGRVVEGDSSNSISLAVSSKQLTHTIPTIQATTGFQTAFARADNASSYTGMDVVVDAGHTFVAGMTAFFVDESTSQETEVLVLDVDATHLYLERSVTIANNTPISANLRINLWRNRDGAADFQYLVRSFANDPSVTSFTFTDDVADDDLLLEYSEPVTSHGEPPLNLHFLTAYKGLLIGATGVDDKAYYSDIDGPEYFAYGLGSYLTLNSKDNSAISGLGANREVLLLFKDSETHSVNGDLSAGSYRQEVLADAVGCSAHSSIVDVDGTLWFYSREFGPRRIVGNTLPDDVSYRVLPYFKGDFAAQTGNVSHTRVVAVNAEDWQMALFYCPVESGNVIDEGSSFVMAADYQSHHMLESDYDEQGRVVNQIPKVSWWPWAGLNMGGGATLYNGHLVWTERRYSSDLGAAQHPLVSFLENENEYDYTDHASFIDWNYESGWSDLGEPELLKKFIRASVQSFPMDGIAASFSVEASTELGYINDKHHSRKVLTFGGGSVSRGWGTWPFGVVAFGEAVTARRLFEFLPTQTTALKLKFAAKLWCQQPIISGWVIEAVPAFNPKVNE